LRSALRSKGNSIMAEVATAKVGPQTVLSPGVATGEHSKMMSWPMGESSAASCPSPPPGLEHFANLMDGRQANSVEEREELTELYSALYSELSHAFEHGQAYQCEMMAHQDVHFSDAVEPQKLPMGGAWHKGVAGMDPELPVKKRVPSFLTEGSASLSMQYWGAEAYSF